jgi:putative transposase
MRHPAHDYSGAAGYFITFVTHDREPLLGWLIGDHLQPSPAGEILLQSWQSLPEAFPAVQLDCIAAMPDHVHCLVLVLPQATDERASLSRIIGSLKQHAARRINVWRGTPGAPVWQRGFMDRVIRDERELEKFRNYIATNALRSARGL